jgi:hypothetical protein
MKSKKSLISIALLTIILIIGIVWDGWYERIKNPNDPAIAPIFIIICVVIGWVLYFISSKNK